MLLIRGDDNGEWLAVSGERIVTENAAIRYVASNTPE